MNDKVLDENAESNVRPSVVLRTLAESLQKNPIPMRDLLKKLGPKGPLLAALLLALPFPVPGSLPGFGVVFGSAIAFVGLSLIYRSLQWPTGGLLAKPIGGELIGRAFCFGATILEKIEPYSRKRLSWLTKGRTAMYALGFSIALCGVLLALPLPPGTNSPPAIAIILLTLSGLTKDGLLMLVGYGRLIANLAFFGALAWFGGELYEHVTAWIG